MQYKIEQPEFRSGVFRLPTDPPTSAGNGFGGGTCPLCPLLDPPLAAIAQYRPAICPIIILSWIPYCAVSYIVYM